ncbi:MAG TPA: hypothetical protein VF179_25375 [Thermoanaerobaculia bacterium]|nr:hypothetical protein [Thermoanaerobaculia bacterium]
MSGAPRPPARSTAPDTAGDPETIEALRRRGHASLDLGWPDPRPPDIFARFADLLDLLDSLSGREGLAAVDAALAPRATSNIRHATALLSGVRFETPYQVLYGHSYSPGTLEALEGKVHLPAPLAALWRSLEAAFAVVDPPLRGALRGLDGVDEMRSCLRLWKYVFQDLPWCSEPHYDATAFTALVASQNPGGELLSLGLEANGAPIDLVRERLWHLRQIQPSLLHHGWIFPGVYANRWGFEPTWHFVRQLPGPSTCRYSLVWRLLHPDDHPVKMSPHIAHLARVAARGNA